VGQTERPTVEMNLFCLATGVNAICFCRASILVFKPRRARSSFSHNLGSAGPPGCPLHSW
jgi:hypothetical protein